MARTSRSCVSVSCIEDDGGVQESRDLRAASSPTKGVPYSSVLASRREMAARLAAAAKVCSKGPQREHGWSSTSADDTQSRGTKSSIGSTASKLRKMSPRALMRKYRSKIKPRTYLYSVFGLVSRTLYPISLISNLMPSQCPQCTKSAGTLLTIYILLKPLHTMRIESVDSQFRFACTLCTDLLHFVILSTSTLFVQIEVIGIAIFCAAAAVGNSCVISNYAARAQDAIGAVSEAFTKKTEQTMWFMQGNLVFSSSLHTFLKNNGTSSSSTLLTQIRHAQSIYQVEHFAVLGTHMQILATPNSQSRIGEVFDPEHIVTAAAAARGDPVWTYGTLSYADLLHEAPPLFRDRASDTDQAEKGYHPYETKQESVIKWTALAVLAVNTTTWDEPTSDAPIIGYLLVGGTVLHTENSIDLFAPQYTVVVCSAL
jgi:hypothetical protein